MTRSRVPSVLRVALLLLIGPSCQTASTAQPEVDLPDLLDSDDVAYFFSRRDLEGLHWALSTVFAKSARNTTTANLPDILNARGGGSSYTSQYKLKLDIEQAHYLLEHMKDQPATREYIQESVLPVYETVLKHIPQLNDLERTKGLYAFRQNDYGLGIQNVYNKAYHHTDFDTLRDETTGEPQSLLNPNLNIPDIEAQWQGTSNRHPGIEGIVYIDNLLNEEALARIRQLLLESTVFYQTKLPLTFGGYTGAYLDDGLHDRILLQLALELAETLPMIGQEHALRYLWAYKYDSNYTGINLHADQAAVNVNLWLTPDEANLDPNTGGLVVFTAKPPPQWNFDQYNTNTDFVVKELLEPNFSNVTVPYRYNRAVLFDSALFHQTDAFSFRQGYENRRINLTLLYGKMQTTELGKEEL